MTRAAAAKIEQIAAVPASRTERVRRRRRTREDVIQRIRDAACHLFAERGYAATTTKEIARLADVSETLVFRHFTDKAGLFGEVVTAPFQALMDDFLQRNPDPTSGADRGEAMRSFTRQVYELFERNEGVFRALLSGPAGTDQAGETPTLRGLDRFFDQSVDQVQRRYEKTGEPAPFDLRVGVRLGLGMIAASVLMRDTLFPDGPPDRAAVIGALEHVVEHALAGPMLD